VGRGEGLLLLTVARRGVFDAIYFVDVRARRVAIGRNFVVEGVGFRVRVLLRIIVAFFVIEGLCRVFIGRLVRVGTFEKIVVGVFRLLVIRVGSTVRLSNLVCVRVRLRVL